MAPHLKRSGTFTVKTVISDLTQDKIYLQHACGQSILLGFKKKTSTD
jgi:hypothetical protein